MHTGARGRTRACALIQMRARTTAMDSRTLTHVGPLRAWMRVRALSLRSQLASDIDAERYGNEMRFINDPAGTGLR